jgi:hypothetical protein
MPIYECHGQRDADHESKLDRGSSRDHNSTTVTSEGGMGVQVQYLDRLRRNLYVKKWSMCSLRLECKTHRLAPVLAKLQ